MAKFHRVYPFPWVVADCIPVDGNVSHVQYARDEKLLRLTLAVNIAVMLETSC